MNALRRIAALPFMLASLPGARRRRPLLPVLILFAAIFGVSEVKSFGQTINGENVALNSRAVITGDLLVPRTPTIKTTGNPTFGGAVEGTGSAQPAGYEVALNGGAQLGRLAPRTDPVSLPSVAAPPAAPVTRDVVLTMPGEGAVMEGSVYCDMLWISAGGILRGWGSPAHPWK